MENAPDSFPNIFSEGKWPFAGDFPGILCGPTHGPGGGTFRPVCSRILAAPADFFRGRIKKSPAIRLNCGVSRNLNTSFFCGEGGIRTRGTLTSTHDFQSCSFDQLGHLSNCKLVLDSEKQPLGILPRLGLFRSSQLCGERRIRTYGTQGVQQISSLPPSTTRPALQCLSAKNGGAVSGSLSAMHEKNSEFFRGTLPLRRRV